MNRKLHSWLLMVFLVVALCASLLNVTTARADGEVPTEPPVAAEVETEPTEAPAESTPEPQVETVATPVAEVLEQAPAETEVVVLDEQGESVPLATEEAAAITEVVDPMWCPEGAAPGSAGCSQNFPTISALLSNMRNNASNYDEAGIIYFTSNPGSQSLKLTDEGTSLGASYNTIKNYNLTLQGGWDPITNTLSGQTNFGTRPLTIGSSTNPWVGNLTLNDFLFSSASASALNIHTTTGDITLNNVDVANQGNGANTALLKSDSGDITVTNGTYDGNKRAAANGNPTGNSSGFSATTNGSISISNSEFTDTHKTSGETPSGATLKGSVVTLANVTAANNEGSGVLVTASSLHVNGGTFSGNQRYGFEVTDTGATVLYIQTSPTCVNNTLGCYNDDVYVPEPPVVDPPATGTNTSNSSSSNGQASPSLIIPLTGGEPISLSCDSAFWVVGIKLSFQGLCDYQAWVHSVGVDSLPGALPDGTSFVMGLDVQVLSDNQAIDQLPSGASMQLDFPITGASDEYAVLSWNGSAWVEVSPQSSANAGMLQILSTQDTGIFVLVKK